MLISEKKFSPSIQNKMRFCREDFQGTLYISPCPPRAEFSNNKLCLSFENFVSTTILERVNKGSLSVWGKVGKVDPLHLVMPFTIEPSKPRLCHDERFLNLWIRDLPFKLDYISHLPRYVGKSHFKITMDYKSGYDHVELSQESRKYFGLQWQGWYFVYNTFSFGKATCTFTTQLVWLPPVTLDPWQCLVVNILITDTLDSFLIPLNLVCLWGIGQI